MSFNDEQSGFVVVDIETVASPDARDLLDPVRPPSNYRDPIKIQQYCEEKLIERVATAGLEADLCEIVAVGFYLQEHGSAQVFTREQMGERGLIEALHGAIANRIVVGFNTLGFDLPVLMRRAQLLDLEPMHFNLDRYRSPHIDLMERLTFHGRLTTRSLAFYKRRFALKTPDDPYSGADIARLVADGDWVAVAHHLRCDVETTTALAIRLGVGALKAQAVRAEAVA